MYSVLGASRSVRVKPPLGSPPQYVKTGVVLPLWVPVQASLFVLWLAWRVGLERRAAALAGCCAACGYDLTGIDGRCPECGAEPFVSDESLDPVWM